MDEKIELDELVKKCMDSEGYVIFAGHITDDIADDGGKKIEFSYRRYHMSLDDVASAAKEFRKHVHKDMEGEGINMQ